jgi:hypothetical protein
MSFRAFSVAQGYVKEARLYCNENAQLVMVACKLDHAASRRVQEDVARVRRLFLSSLYLSRSVAGRA